MFLGWNEGEELFTTKESLLLLEDRGDTLFWEDR